MGKRSQPRRTARTPVPRPAWRPAGWRIAGAISLILAAAAAVIITLPGRGPALPRVDLADASPAVRAALERYMDAARRNPRSGAAWGELGSALLAYRRVDAAREALSRAAELEPADPRWFHLRAITRLESDPDGALEDLRRAADRCGVDPPGVRYRMAELLAEQGRWTEAGEALRPLLERSAVAPQVRLLAARVAEQDGDVARAMELARSAARQPATSAGAHALLARLLLREGDPEGARRAAEVSRASPPDEAMPDPFLAGALALAEGPAILSIRVHPLLARRDLRAAGEIIDRMMRDHPEFPDTWLAAGRMELLRNNATEAERLFRRHLELDPDSMQGWFQLGMSLLAQRRDADAAEAFSEAIRRKPDSGPAWHNRGYALGRMGRRAEAIEAFRNVLRHNPEHLESYLLLADLHLQERDRTRAREVLDRAERLRPGDPRVRSLLRRAGFNPPGE